MSFLKPCWPHAPRSGSGKFNTVVDWQNIIQANYFTGLFHRTSEEKRLGWDIAPTVLTVVVRECLIPGDTEQSSESDVDPVII